MVIGSGLGMKNRQACMNSNSGIFCGQKFLDNTTRLLRDFYFERGENPEGRISAFGRNANRDIKPITRLTRYGFRRGWDRNLRTLLRAPRHRDHATELGQ